MNSSKDYLELVERLKSDIMKEKALDEQTKLTLQTQTSELETLYLEVSRSVSDLDFETTFSSIDKSIRKMESSLTVSSRFRRELTECSESPLTLTSIQSLTKQVANRNQCPNRLLAEIESLLSKLSDQSIDSIRKIRHEIDKEIEREKLPGVLSDLQKSTVMNQVNLDKLKERNKNIMLAYKEKIDGFNSNSSRIALIEKGLQAKRDKLLQVETIFSLVNEEILSWSFHLDKLRNTRIQYDKSYSNNKKTVLLI